MLQPMEWQRVEHDLVNEQHGRIMSPPTPPYMHVLILGNHEYVRFQGKEQ